nr:hepatoma-derived growth factor-related protein 2-like [Quercus suber]
MEKFITDYRMPSNVGLRYCEEGEWSSSTLSISDPQLESPDPKRKRPSKDKDPVDEGRSCSLQEEDEARRPSKQLRISGQGKGKEVIQQSEPQAWLPAAMLHRKPLMDNATLRDFQGGEGARVADALERSLLLPADIAELRDMRRQEVARNLERRSEADLKKAREDLEEMMKARDNAVSDLAGIMKQAKDQTSRLRDAEGQLQVTKEHIADLKQKLAEAVRAKGVTEYARDEALRAKEEAMFARTDAERSVEQAEEETFAEGVAKIEAALKAQVPEIEALNQAGVEASSELKRAKRVYYAPAIRDTAPVTSEAGSDLRATNGSQVSVTKDPASSDKPVEEIVHQGALEGAGIDNPEVP